MTVDFGGSNAEYELRRHDGLRKRAQPTASTSAYLAASTSISFPIPPSGSPVPKGFSAQGYVGFQYLDTSILPPNIPGVDNVALHGPFVWVWSNLIVYANFADILTDHKDSLSNARIVQREERSILFKVPLPWTRRTARRTARKMSYSFSKTVTWSFGWMTLRLILNWKVPYSHPHR